MREMDCFFPDQKSQYTVSFSEKACWITHPEPAEQVLQLVRRFYCPSADKARLTICGLGFFNARINGQPLDNAYFQPMVTDYNSRDTRRNPALQVGNRTSVCAHEYDVTALLQTGENILEITLGNGYYHNEDRPEEPYVSYGEKKAIFDLEVDGVHIVSDPQVEARYLSIVSGLYNGDLIDFSAGENAFVHAVPAVAPDSIWRTPEVPPDRVAQVLEPRKIWEQAGTVFDFGINHSGGVAFEVQGQPGQTLHLQFAETLHEDGTMNMKTGRWEEFSANGRLLHRIDQTATYILSGGVDRIEPQFSWHCYRYVKVNGIDRAHIQNMRSLYVHMDLEQQGSLAAAEPIFEEIHEKFCTTAYNNLHAGLLTDCPHREKRSYTGDGQIVAEALLYEMDAVGFLGKWLVDLVYAQTAEGFIPYTVPYMSGGGGYAWSSAIAVIPDLLYRYTGELKYVQLAYPAVVKWIGYCQAHAKRNIVIASDQEWLLGDWLTPDITGFNVPLMSTLWYYRSVSLAAWFAELLGTTEDQRRFEAQKAQIAQAINAEFFDRENLRYCRGIQGENVLPLVFGIVPEEYVPKMHRVLRRHYETLDYHFDTGIIVTPYLLEYLTCNGMEDIAFKLMTQRDYPSYAYMLKGETTIPEHWSKMWPDYFVNDTKFVKGGGDVSHCHPMFGSVVAWIYKRVAGLDASGFWEGRIRFEPKFTAWMKYGRCKTATPAGEAAIDWQMTGDGFSATVQIPQGLQGQVILPVTATACQGEKTIAGRELLLEAGCWHIRQI